MKDFLLLHRPDGCLSDDDLGKFLIPKYRTHLGAAHHEATWAAIAFGVGHGADVMWASKGRGGGAGVAALDNASELARAGNAQGDKVSDTLLALTSIAVDGPGSIRKLLGAIGLVYIDETGRHVILARDAIGVAPLYYRFINDLLAISSSATVLSANCEIDRQFLADYLVNGTNPEQRSIYGGVYALPPGTYAWRAHNHLESVRFWSTYDFVPNPRIDQTTAAIEFRRLLDAAVVASVGDEAGTWSELSGGVDSSSVVSVAAVLARRRELRTGLKGTISMVDELGWGDERPYSSAVVSRYDLENVEVRPPEPFAGDTASLELADTPSRGFAASFEFGIMKQLLRDRGCSRVLSGLGPDHYLKAKMGLAHTADLFAKGKLVAGARDILSWSIVTRTSFWRNLRRHCFSPLTPMEFRRRSRAAARCVPTWVDRDFATRYDLRSRTVPVRRYDAPWGKKFAGITAYYFTGLEQQLHPSLVFDSPQWRYPFLYRPLIEYALTLPPSIRAQPYCDKLVLRQALGDDLPDIVKTRTGKGRIGTRALWALTQHGAVVDRLSAEPLLAEMGCINPRKFRRSIERARGGELSNWTDVLMTLSRAMASHSGGSVAVARDD